MARHPQILVLQNEVEARRLEAVLRERNIPHYLKSYHDAAYDGIWQTQMGWGQVEAPPEYREEIETIYADLKAAGPSEEGEAE